MTHSLNLDAVFAAYPGIGRVTDARYLGGAGGFSGARFWRVETSKGPFCLRRWPVEYPPVGELDFMHRVLWHARAKGFEVAAVPLKNSDGATYVSHCGHLWELTPWLVGEADASEQPSDARVAASMECLARFHRASEEFAWDQPSVHGSACPIVGVSPGVGKRTDLLRIWITGRSSELQEAVKRGTEWPEMERMVEQLLRCLPCRVPAVADHLTLFGNCPVALQPCIRDVWQDHILFDGNRVTGLIDFGSMGIDNVSCDVARLLGGLSGGDSNVWQIGLRAYASIRPLSEVELGLAEAFAQSGVLLGALNWAGWVFLERRVFEEPQAVLRRMKALMVRLESDTDLPPSGRELLL